MDDGVEAGDDIGIIVPALLQLRVFSWNNERIRPR